MFIITKEKSIRQKNIIGIFDLDNSTVSGVTKNFLSTAEKENKIKGINILPKSFILTDLKNPKKNYNNCFKIYFSSHISNHIYKFTNKQNTKRGLK